jgi:hypothetical protein
MSEELKDQSLDETSMQLFIRSIPELLPPNMKCILISTELSQKPICMYCFVQHYVRNHMISLCFFSIWIFI